MYLEPACQSVVMEMLALHVKTLSQKVYKYVLYCIQMVHEGEA